MTRRPSFQKDPAGSDPAHSALPSSPEATGEPRLETLRALVDNLDDAVVVLARNGQVQFANAAAERLYGIAPQGPALAGWSETYGIYLPDRRTLWPAEELPGALALRGQTVETEQYIQPPGATEGYWIAMRATAAVRPTWEGAGCAAGMAGYIRRAADGGEPAAAAGYCGEHAGLCEPDRCDAEDNIH